MPEFAYDLKIPKERIAVLIGKNGETKAQLEEATSSNLDIDSKEGDVTITGNDAIGLYSAREIIKAIGRGFNPEIALLLTKQDYVLEILEVTDYVKDKKSHMERIKGRVIGTGGKTRKTIETLTGCSVSVYGKTIGIIGEAESATIARRAVESLLNGSPHKNVYKWLEKRYKELQMRQFAERNL
ncbi:RNA-processing protein [Candidatus Woesearchaeota archaeon]|nr:RNA-processing protein [Candidatus Woesearchaeota archaeon]